MRRQTMRGILPGLLSVFLLGAAVPGKARAGRDPAETLWENAEKAMESQRYAEALRLYERSMALCKTDELDCQSSNYNGMARAYEGLGDDLRARRCYEASLRINRRRQSEPDIAIDLISLGSVLYMTFDEHARALPMFEECLGIYRKLGQRGEVALTLSHLGAVKTALGRYPEAIRDLEESLSINRSLRNETGTATVLAHLGDASNRSGDYEKAGAFYEEALSGLRRQKRLKEVAAVLNRRGLNDLDQHRIGSAMTSFEEALRLGRQLGDQLVCANALLNQGVLQLGQGQYEKARGCDEQALVLCQQLKKKSVIAIAFNNLGQVHDAMGRYDQAIAQYRAALSLNRELGYRAEIAVNLNNIAMVYYAMKRFDEAIPWLQQALDAERQLGNPVSVARSLSNIGVACLFSGDFARAEAFLLERKALQGRLRGMKLRNPGLTELYLLTGRPGQALDLLKAEPAGAFASEPAVAEYLMQLGRAQSGLGQLVPASENLLKAYTILEEIRSATADRTGFLSAGSGGGRFRTYRALSSVLAERALKGEAMDPAFRPYGDSLAAAAFFFSESTKARSLIENLAVNGRTATMGATLPSALRREEEHLRSRMAALEGERDRSAKEGSSAYARNSEQRAALARELDAFVTRLRKDQPVYAAVNYPRPVPAAELPLAANELMLAYALGEKSSYLFAIRRGGVEKVFRVPASRAELEEKVRTFLSPLNNRKPSDFSVQHGQDLFRMLLADGLALARAEDQIVIIPDGILGTLPYEILVTRLGTNPEDSGYAGEKRTFTYNQSASLLSLKRTLPSGRAPRPLFALGNPDFSTNASAGGFRGIAVGPVPGGSPMVVPSPTGSTPQIEFPPLPETEVEVRSIAASMNVPVQAPDILLGRRASEAEVKKAPLGEYRILHWATHAALAGMIQDINEPFLLLSQYGRTRENDGFFTLSEVLDLRLNADLVVLSACVTGLGRNVEGEGVANFARAFQAAGAKRVVVSLWEVASEPTVEFATLIYAGLKEGKGYSEAMKAAQNVMRKKYPNPYYWGVFILHGEL